MSELDTLIQLLAKLPGLGPRSARRAALYLIKRRESLLEPLAAALAKAAEAIRPCPICGNLDTIEPCAICRDPERDTTSICVVEDLADLWALERTGAFRGRYHVLGGTLSALDGIGPHDLNIERLLARLRPGHELILALNATVEGQTTAHYLADRLAGRDCHAPGRPRPFGHGDAQAAGRGRLDQLRAPPRRPPHRTGGR